MNRTHVVWRDTRVAILASSVRTAIFRNCTFDECNQFIPLCLLYKLHYTMVNYTVNTCLLTPTYTASRAHPPLKECKACNLQSRELSGIGGGL